MTTNYNTRMDKGRDGWNAQTRIAIEARPGYFLKLRTSKSRGGICTYAGTEKVDGGWVQTRIFRDFHKTVLAEPGRCTEKSIREQHQRALEQVPGLLRLEAEWEVDQTAKSLRESKAAGREPTDEQLAEAGAAVAQLTLLTKPAEPSIVDAIIDHCDRRATLPGGIPATKVDMGGGCTAFIL